MNEQNRNYEPLSLGPSYRTGEGKPREQMTIGEQMSAARDRQASFRLEAEVRDAARKLDLSTREIEDLVQRARQEFVILNGEPRAIRTGRSEALRNAIGRLLTVEEWAIQIKERSIRAVASVLSSPAWAEKNPYRRESWNLTEQMRIQRRDPALAARLKQEA